MAPTDQELDGARDILSRYASIAAGTANGAASLALLAANNIEEIGRFWTWWNTPGPRDVGDLFVPLDFTLSIPNATLGDSIPQVLTYTNSRAWYARRVTITGTVDLDDLRVEVTTNGNFRVTAGAIPAMVRFQPGLNNVPFEPAIRLSPTQQLNLGFLGSAVVAKSVVATVSGVALAF